MEGLEDRRIGERSWWDHDVGKHLLVALVGGELALGSVLAVHGLEAHRETPRFVLGSGAQELEGLVPLQGGEVLVVLAPGIEEASLSGKATPEVEGLTGFRHLVADPVFSHEASVVAGLPEELRVGLAPRCRAEFGAEIVDLVASLVLPGKDAGTAHHADGSGDKGVLEDVAFCGKGVEVRGLADLVPGKAEGVVTQVINEKKKDVGPGSGRGEERKGQEERQGGREDSHARLLRGAG